MNLAECVARITENKYIDNLVVILQAKNHLSDQVVDGTVILKWRITQIGCKHEGYSESNLRWAVKKKQREKTFYCVQKISPYLSYFST
jgi:hypothetical protein